VSGLRAACKPDTQPSAVEQAIRSAVKTHLLHLVGILFPYNIDDARSKPHQIIYNVNYFTNYCHKYVITLVTLQCVILASLKNGPNDITEI
jgi:hypothetical protein